MSYLAIKHRELLAEKFKGTALGGGADYAEWVAATARLLQIAAALTVS